MDHARRQRIVCPHYCQDRQVKEEVRLNHQWLVDRRSVFLGFPDARPAESLSPEEIYQTVLPGVMTLEVETRGGEKTVGTAFLAVREGVAVTAWHLVQDARKVVARFANHEVAEVAGCSTGTRPGTSLGASECAGAFIEPALPHRSADRRARLCDWRSQGIRIQHQRRAGQPDPNHRRLRAMPNLVPHLAGQHGGPVFNARGEVLGVVTWSKKDAQNLNFATPSACLRALNAQAPVTQWSGLSRQRRTRQHSLVAQAQQERLTTTPPSGELEALRALLQRSAGEKVVVTVLRGSQAKRFR